MWLTLATFVGYAIVYTVLLKPATPQNIVIGGASGAMPPVLGWAAVTGDVGPEPLILFLIIFVWTPPHFWSLALYRVRDYANAGLPMLPVTHGRRYTQLQIVLYTCALVAVSLLPYAIRMSGAALPGRRAGAGRRLPACMRCSSTATTAILSRGRRSSIRSGISRRCSRRSSSITTGDERRDEAARPSSSRSCADARRLRPRRTAIPDRPTLPARRWAAISRSRTTTARRARSPISAGKAVVLFFGYTQCPDVCPTTLATLAEALRRLGPDAAKVQVLFVTIDPSATPRSSCRIT